MPFYEYFCQDYENKFEVKASLSEKEKGLRASGVTRELIEVS